MEGMPQEFRQRSVFLRFRSAHRSRILEEHRMLVRILYARNQTLHIVVSGLNWFGVTTNDSPDNKPIFWAVDSSPRTCWTSKVITAV
jgi:hypothetical protein